MEPRLPRDAAHDVQNQVNGYGGHYVRRTCRCVRSTFFSFHFPITAKTMKQQIGKEGLTYSQDNSFVQQPTFRLTESVNAAG